MRARTLIVRHSRFAVAASSLALAGAAAARRRAMTGRAAIMPAHPCQRRSGGVRGPLRARQELPRLELFVIRRRPASRRCAGSSARSCRAPRRQLLRVGRARRRRDRAALGASSNIRSTASAATTASFETPADPARQGLRGRLQSRQPLPRLDLSAAGLRPRGRALLSEGHDQAAAPAAVLHFRRGAVSGRSIGDRSLHRGEETRQPQARRPCPDRLVLAPPDPTSRPARRRGRPDR